MSGFVLTGLYDSPFVRRAALALTFHGIEFTRRELSVFGDFDAVLEVNPLGRAPALEMEDGRVLVDSRAIVEWVESWADPERPRLTPREQEDLLVDLKIEGVAIGLAELAVAASAEGRRAPELADADRAARLERQMESALGWLETRIAADAIGTETASRGVFAAVCAATYLARKHPGIYAAARRPALDALRLTWEARAPFDAVPFPED